MSFIFLPPCVEMAQVNPLAGISRITSFRDASLNHSSPVASAMLSATLFASIATTMHWLPNFSAARLIKWGSFTAVVLIETLSHPALSRALISSVFYPPPTYMNTSSAVLRRHENYLPFRESGNIQEDEFISAHLSP
jgi:hypothetical protein